MATARAPRGGRRAKPAPEPPPMPAGPAKRPIVGPLVVMTDDEVDWIAAAARRRVAVLDDARGELGGIATMTLDERRENLRERDLCARIARKMENA